LKNKSLASKGLQSSSYTSGYEDNERSLYLSNTKISAI